MLEGQCTSWGGPVVAILYLSLELFDTNNALHIEQARAQAADLHARMEEAGEGARVDFWAGVGWRLRQGIVELVGIQRTLGM